MPEQIRSIELLAPAKDLATGIAALTHGADAIYIGAPAFGARQAAAVSLEDIAALCREARLYRAKVYVALNTILYEEELSQALKLIEELYQQGVDAIIVQDMGLVHSNKTPISLHASTQCHVDGVERVRELAASGIEQVVLARELNLAETERIHRACPNVRLEAFIHGSLCVSYSGRCYLSQAIKTRSANRGDCAQLCRLAYSLSDAKGKVILRDQYLLSPKDMNRSQELQRMLEAGISSFKIEGRLKGIAYVKNLVAYYRQLIDRVIEAEPNRYRRQSVGLQEYRFIPDPSRSFNRGFTSLLEERSIHKAPSINPQTNKSIGKLLGKVHSIKAGRIYMQLLDKGISLVPGDGICLMGSDGKWQGSNLSKVNADGSIELDKDLAIAVGAELYRNLDLKFEKTLKDELSAKRRIPVCLKLSDAADGLKLWIGAEGYESSHAIISTELELAEKFRPEEIKEQLGKLGNTPLIAQEIELELSQDFFIPKSLLAELRRTAVVAFVEKAQELKLKTYNKAEHIEPLEQMPYLNQRLDYSYNVSNSGASAYYKELGATEIAPAFELKHSQDAALMSSKHCLKAYLGHCPRLGQSPLPYTEPLMLSSGNIRLRLAFDCQACLMKIYQA